MENTGEISIISCADVTVANLFPRDLDRDHTAGHSRGYHGGRGRGRRGRGGGFGSSDGAGGQSKFKKSYSEEVHDQVDTLYSKRFRFNDEYSQWKLPDLSDWFEQSSEGEETQVAGFLGIKKQLDDLKSTLDDIEPSSWSRHTHFTNRSGIVVPALRRDFEPEMCTQVWVSFSVEPLK